MQQHSTAPLNSPSSLHTSSHLTNVPFPKPLSHFHTSPPLVSVHSGTSIDLDLNEVMHGWRLKSDRAGKRAKAAAAARQARAAAASGAGAAAAGVAAGMAGAGAAGGSHWTPIDPVSLVDVTLKKVKEGVTEPQMYHTVTSVQVRGRGVGRGVGTDKQGCAAQDVQGGGQCVAGG